jgi:choline dehydrogenase
LLGWLFFFGHQYICLCSSPQVNQRHGLRLSSHGAFLRPILGRPNLTVRSDAHVDRLHLTAQAAGGGGGGGAVRCEGVVVRDTGGRSAGECLSRGSGGGGGAGEGRLIRAHKEVVLAAGAIGSPHLLQCSGVGPPELLRDNGVKPIVALPGVGVS